MSQLLKQSTAASVLVGPVLDSTGAAYTSMAIGDFNITKNGTTAAMASAATATHSHNGHYIIALTTGNTDTLGRLAISCNKSTYTMGRYTATVLTSSTFDAIVTNAATAAGGLCDVQRIRGVLPVMTLNEITSTYCIDSNPMSLYGSGALGQVVFQYLSDNCINDGFDNYSLNAVVLRPSQDDVTFNSLTVTNAFATGTFTIGGTSLSDLISSGSLTAAAVWSFGDRHLTQDRTVTVPSVQKKHRQIVQGDTYSTTARAFNVLASDGGEWPTDLSTYTWACTLSIDPDNTNSGSSSVTASVTAPTTTGSSRYLAIAITAAQTGAMATGRYNYDVQGTNGTTKWTVETGTIDVIEDFTA